MSKLLVCPSKRLWIPNPVNFNAHAGQKKAFEIYQKDPVGFEKKAEEESRTLLDGFEKSLKKVSGNLVKLAQDITNPDMPFTADGAMTLTIGNEVRTLLSRFKNAPRQAEVETHRITLENVFKGKNHNVFNRSEKTINGKKTIFYSETPFYFEGTGDTIYDPYRDVFWAGYTTSENGSSSVDGRSDIRAHGLLENFMETKVISIKASDPFFHIDTFLCALPRGEIVLYTGNLTDEDRATIKEQAFTKYGLNPDDYLIEINASDALAYGANIRIIGNDLFVPAGTSEEYRDTLKSRGYNVFAIDLENHIMAGGAAHCMSNNLTKQKVFGGYHAEENRHLMPEIA